MEWKRPVEKMAAPDSIFDTNIVIRQTNRLEIDLQSLPSVFYFPLLLLVYLFIKSLADRDKNSQISMNETPDRSIYKRIYTVSQMALSIISPEWKMENGKRGEIFHLFLLVK